MIKKTLQAIVDIFPKVTKYFKTLKYPRFSPSFKPLPSYFPFNLLRSIYHAFPIPLKQKIILRWYLTQIITFRQRKKKIEEYLRNRAHLPAFKPLKKTNSLPDIIIFSLIDWTFRIQR